MFNLFPAVPMSTRRNISACHLLLQAIGKRLPGKLNQKFRNVAPTFYSGRAPLHLTKHPKGSEAMEQYNTMMDERFEIFVFFSPLPKQTRVKKWPKCGRCAAQFYLKGHPDVVAAPLANYVDTQLLSHAAYTQSQNTAGDTNNVGDSSSLFSQLAELASFRNQGLLDESEFTTAKRLLLGMCTA